MNVDVVSPRDDLFAVPDRETVSPELALVDPELARRARAALPNPGEKAALARISAELERAHSTPPRAATPVLRRAGARPRWLVPVLAGLALVATLVLSDVRVEIGGTPASATQPVSSVPEPVVAPAAASTPAPRVPAKPNRQPRNRPRASSPQPQRLAWAPVAGASRYHVELFRGVEKIFAADTTRATLTLPARWRHAGRGQALRPGTYRWYVWPVSGGRRASAAIVQARLTIDRG